MSDSRLDIQANHLAIVKRILKIYLPANAIVWVFGSRVKQCATPYSDLDLAIDLQGECLSTDTLSDLKEAFDESELPYKIDVVDWNAISDAFKSHIHQERIKLIL